MGLAGIIYKNQRAKWKKNGNYLQDGIRNENRGPIRKQKWKLRIKKNQK